MLSSESEHTKMCNVRCAARGSSLSPWQEAFLLVRVFAVVPSIDMTQEVYLKKIVPVGFLFAVSLWMSNTAYIYLSVAFIQMVSEGGRGRKKKKNERETLDFTLRDITRGRCRPPRGVRVTFDAY